MGPRLIAFALVASLALIQPVASAATKKPTPTPKVTAKASAKPSAKVTAKPTTKPSAKVTAKPTTKPTSKPSAKATSKPTTKSSPKSTSTSKATTKATTKPTTSNSKPTAKASVKPSAKATPKPTKKKVRLSPSPKPSWPPTGFSAEGEVFAKVPTAKELVGLISANKSLSSQIKDCEKFICGAVQVASETGCLWWEVISTVAGGDGKKLGELTTVHGASKEREIKTLLAISPESNANGGNAKIDSVICHHEDRVSSQATVTYKKS